MSLRHWHSQTGCNIRLVNFFIVVFNKDVICKKNFLWCYGNSQKVKRKGKIGVAATLDITQSLWLYSYVWDNHWYYFYTKKTVKDVQAEGDTRSLHPIIRTQICFFITLISPSQQEKLFFDQMYELYELSDWYKWNAISQSVPWWTMSPWHYVSYNSPHLLQVK